MTIAPVRPPMAATWLLARILPGHLRDAMIGDLEECFREKQRVDGNATRANAWYWREVLMAPRTWFAAPPVPATLSSRSGDGVMTILLSDIRFAWRMLWHRAGSTLLAVLTLALGIGATTAIFSVVNPILMEPLPFPHAEQLSMVWEREKNGDKSNVGFLTFDDMTRQLKSFESMSAMSYWTGNITTESEPHRLNGQRVSPSYFHVLGVAPALGRDFRAEDNVRGTPRVVMLSHALWRNLFAGDATLVGKTITLDGLPFTVVGVMPAGFENVLDPTAMMWSPLRYDATLPQACRDCRHLRVVARRQPGVSVAQATRELDVFARNLFRDYPTLYSGTGMSSPDLARDLTKSVKPALLAVLGAVLLVLLIACLNVSNLLLARSVNRRGEFALRAALGAARGRLVRQLLTESVVLATLGGVAGVAVAFVGVKGLVMLSPTMLPRLSAVHVDASVLAFALLVTTLAGVAFGLVPAWQASRGDLHHDMRQGSRQTVGTSRKTRASLVIAEVALAMVLLVGSGLLLRSMRTLLAVNPGFNASGLLTMQVEAGSGRVKGDTSVRAFFVQALDAVRQQPGIVSAALTSQLPLSGDFDGYGVHIQARPSPNPADDPSAFRYAVSDGYFETMQVPLVRGRLFTVQDREGQPPVVIINAAFAAAHLNGLDPIGQRVRIGDPNAGAWREIVGIVGDVKQVSLAAELSDAIYLPESQWIFTDYAMSMVVRTRGDAAAFTPVVRSAIWSVDKDQPIERIATAQALIRITAAERRFALVLFEVFGLVSLVLAAAGIYGVLTGSVTERMRELGVRSALGASGTDLVRMVLRQGMVLSTSGVVVGLALAIAGSRAITSMLFGVTELDPLTYVGVTVALGLVSLVACWLPAARAARVDPMEVLRAD